MDIFSPAELSMRPSENPDHTMRKNALVKSVHRKPFVDRSVNSKTPIVGKLSKGSHAFKLQQSNTPKKEQVIKDLDAHEYIFSYKDKDFEYRPPHLGTDNIIKILRSYCGNNQITPPPSPVGSPIEIEPIFLNLPDTMDFEKQTEEIFFERIDEDNMSYDNKYF